MMYASQGFTRGDPFFVNVPTIRNWNRSISARPRAAMSGVAASSSAQVNTVEILTESWAAVRRV